MYRIIYVSKVVENLSEENHRESLEIAQERNGVSKITGVLLFHNERFMQVLEGDKDVVKTLLAKIEADSRHADMEIIFEENTADRIFTGWNMAYVPISEGLKKKLQTIGGFEVLFKATDEAAPSKGIVAAFLSAVLSEVAKASVIRS